jgi:hypothetical protein
MSSWTIRLARELHRGRAIDEGAGKSIRYQHIARKLLTFETDPCARVRIGIAHGTSAGIGLRKLERR